MKKALKIATVLTWGNLILWGFIAACMLLTSPLFGIVTLISGVLLSAIPLNCYAALQLHRSIRNRAIKLNNQTPVGIRFVGAVALFFGLMMVMNCIGYLQSPGEMLEVTKQSLPQMKGLDAPQMSVAMIRKIGIIGLILGSAVVVNVLLNFRLLRWYYLVQQSDAS